MDGCPDPANQRPARNPDGNNDRPNSTLGCVRLHNQDLRDKLLPLVEKGTVYVSVDQED
jgi:hypothetical protein